MTPPVEYSPQPAPKNNVVKPLLIGCGLLVALVAVVGSIGAYVAVHMVTSAVQNSKAAQVAQGVVTSAQQAVDEAGASPDPAHAAAAGVAVLKSLVGGGKNHVATLTRADIKADLPTSVDSLARTNAESRSGSYGGISGTSASATYGSGDGTVSIEVTDAANLSGLTTVMGLAMGMESEDDSGYEKAVQLGDVKVHEKWRTQGKGSELVGIVGDRFVISVTGNGVDMSVAEKAFQSVDIAKLESAAADTPK